MASKVVVHFEANGVPHRVEIVPAEGKVESIILLPKGQMADQFATDHKMNKPNSGLPPGLSILGPNDQDVTDQMLKAGFGPGVCYTIGVQVFCW